MHLLMNGMDRIQRAVEMAIPFGCPLAPDPRCWNRLDVVIERPVIRVRDFQSEVSLVRATIRELHLSNIDSSVWHSELRWFADRAASRQVQAENSYA
jgi:hypothetical protein